MAAAGQLHSADAGHRGTLRRRGSDKLDRGHVSARVGFKRLFFGHRTPLYPYDVARISPRTNEADGFALRFARPISNHEGAKGTKRRREDLKRQGAKGSVLFVGARRTSINLCIFASRFIFASWRLAVWAFFHRALLGFVAKCHRLWRDGPN